jgi:RNA polymerase sigma-70 factor (ECF subfamily)
MTQPDRSAFQSLHDQYYSMVLNLCRGYMKGDREMASDLAQEVFINVWNALPGYRGEASYKTWIYRITVNTCLMLIRKNKKQIKVPVELALHASEPAQSQKDSEYLYRAIGNLDEVERIIIMMVLEEIDYEEIARTLGITENNLRVKVHRARAKLKTLIEHEQRMG